MGSKAFLVLLVHYLPAAILVRIKEGPIVFEDACTVVSALVSVTALVPTESASAQPH